LRNAVLCAAAAKPNGSPLDFMLGLMRDPNVPTDLRVEMAAGRNGALRRQAWQPAARV